MCNQISIIENTTRVTSFDLQYYNSSTSTWITIHSDTIIGTKLKTFKFEDFTSRYVRLYINSASANPQITELIVSNYKYQDYIYYKVNGENLSLGIQGYYERT